MDTHGVDQSECEMQFIIGMNSRPLAKSVADLHHHHDHQEGGEQPEEDDDEEYYYDDYCDYYPESDCMHENDDDDAISAPGRDTVEPPAVCCRYEPCPEDQDAATTSISSRPDGVPFCDLEGLDWRRRISAHSWG